MAAETTNERLFREAKTAIDQLFSDRTVSQSRARDNLATLRDEIDVLIDTLEEDEGEDE